MTIENIKAKFWSFDGLILFIAIFVLLFYLVMDAPHEKMYILKIGLDDLIPRVPIFTIPYIAFLIWVPATLFYAFLCNRFFRQLAYSFIVINLIAFVVYIVFQTHVPRDPITSNDIFSKILQFIYDNNLPYAGFPSLHSALSVSIATYYVCIKSKWSILAIVMAVSVVVSTLLTKQHFFVDAVSGITLGIFMTWVVFHFLPKNKSENKSNVIV